MRSLKSIVFAVVLIASTVSLVGCFDLAGQRGGANALSLSWEFFRPDGSRTSALSAQSVSTLATSLEGKAVGYYVADTSPMDAGFIRFTAKNDQIPVPARWSVGNAAFGTLTPSKDKTSSILHFDQAGSTSVTAVVGSDTVTQDVVIYPGFVLDNGKLGYADPASDRGHVGYSFATGAYTTSPAGADIYIDDSGGVVVPGGFVIASAKTLADVSAVPDMSGATTQLAAADYPPTLTPEIVVITTLGGKHVVLDAGSWWASSQGYRAYAFGYRALD